MKRFLAFAVLVDITMSVVLGLAFFGIEDSLFFAKGFGLVCACDAILSVAIRTYMFFKSRSKNQEEDIIEDNEIRFV